MFRALQVEGTLSCPVLPCPGRTGQVTLPVGQGRARYENF